MSGKERTGGAERCLRRNTAALCSRGAAFCLGAAGYGGLEVLWRGYTHWTMLLAGGTCLLALRGVSRTPLPFPVQCALGSALITGVELAVGLVCNRALHMAVWDYSAQWGNILGQICPLYSLLWLGLCVPVVGVLRLAARR